MKILIDISGSDNGFSMPIKAAITMVNKIEEKIVLVGKKDDIIKEFKEQKKQDLLNKFEILECQEYISNSDEPAFAIKNKKQSNIVVAYNYMKENDEVVLISASSTGALMAGALLKVGRIKGIHRPALITILPTVKDRKVVFLDSGANPEAKEISLIQYAKLGEIYSKLILKVNEPKISLLNIGAEEEKGTPNLKETYKVLKRDFPNFIGNIEARYILNGNTDVIVCDGLMGNIALKSLEGTLSTVKRVISYECKKNVVNMVKGLFLKSILKNGFKNFNYKEYGGAILLGVKKPVIKVHGNSSAVTYEKAIIQASHMLENDIVGRIEREITKNNG